MFFFFSGYLKILYFKVLPYLPKFAGEFNGQKLTVWIMITKKMTDP